MGKLLRFWLLGFAWAGVPAAAQDFLPPSIGGWTAPAAATKARPEGLEQFTGDDAAILREYGILEAERRAYSRDAESLTVTLYRMRDPSAAYGAYTFLRTDDMAAANLTQHCAVSRQRDLAVVGNFLVDATGGDLRSAGNDLKTLAAQLAPRADRTPFPTLGDYLPTRGLVHGSERYVLGPLALNRLLPLGEGDWLGFADGADAELARYRINGQQATLLLVIYPTPQVAARKLEELSRWFTLNTAESRSIQADGRPLVFARRTSSLVALVAQTRSRVVADSLLSRIQYESQVTWNEPGFRLTDPSVSQMVVGAILGTGVILLFALVAGIGFAGVRLVVKYFFPGEVFDRPAKVEILQLGLSSKPIEAKDFY